MLAGAFVGFVLSCASLIGQLFWEHTDDRDPAKVLAQDVFRTIAVWIGRVPLLTNCMSGLRRIAAWRRPPANNVGVAT